MGLGPSIGSISDIHSTDDHREHRLAAVLERVPLEIRQPMYMYGESLSLKGLESKLFGFKS